MSRTPANVVKLPQAEEDLHTIWRTVAGGSPAAADRLLDDLEETLRLLADYPALGPARDVLAPGVRVFPVDNYLIFYRTPPNGIEVVRVLHAARDLDALF